MALYAFFHRDLSRFATIQSPFQTCTRQLEIGPRVTGRESGSPGSSKELNRDVESTLTVMASTNGQPGTWKDVDASDPVILVTEFGCRYLKFHLGVSPAKKPCVELSAFDVMQSAAHQYICGQKV